MKIRIAVAILGFGCVEAGAFLIYRPMSLILLGALFLAVARGGKA